MASGGAHPSEDAELPPGVSEGVPPASGRARLVGGGVMTERAMDRSSVVP
jgi:hypothetical protein